MPALRRLRKQEHHEFKASLSNLEIGAGKRKGAGKGKRMDEKKREWRRRKGAEEKDGRGRKTR